ncbi:MAG: serine/threonine protein kinase [Gammaproteobacteria bacterium]|nr:serine/threonine protein kinase [Gammaproteobacteria bacterium]MDH4256004.1 serine/threonine protein kinase [Gammaproteobacteria bacterium]MDH5308720.1 serine/threonine protein kinase [Gammaproteobacteria bacterium]
MGSGRDTPHPYASLGPEQILAALENLGYSCDGRLLTLNSYENRVYRVGVDDGDAVVAKFYRPGRWSDDAILEEHAFAAELAANDLPVVAPLPAEGRTLHVYQDFRYSVSPCMGGRAPDLEDHQLLRQLGRLVARLHLTGEIRDFQHRPALDIDSYGYESREYLLASGLMPPELAEVYRGVTKHVLANVEACYERAGRTRYIRLHGDFHIGNVLVDEDRLHIVDLDDCRSAPAVQDLWMFLSGDRDEQTGQLGILLEGYEEFRRFDARELNLVEALRTLRIMHYAAWLARRRDDPAFEAAFPWFGSQRYWEEHLLSLREQVALTEEPPLAWFA